MSSLSLAVRRRTGLDGARPRGRRGTVTTEVAAGAIGVGVLAAWAFAAVAHIGDGYGLDHVAGAWMALTQHFARTGSIYPPLYHDGLFVGTRLIPLQILLDGGAARVTGEYVVSGKAVEDVVFVVLLVAIYRILRGLGCSLALSLALVAAVVASTAGTIAGDSIRGDALPVVLQVSAVALVARGMTKRSLAAAGVLCALAIAAKFSAVWAVPAIGVYAWQVERRNAVRFAFAFVASAVLILGALELASHLRMSAEVAGLALAGGGTGARGLVEAPWAAFRQSHWGDDVVILAAAVALVAALARRGVALGLWLWSFLFAGVVTIVIFSDVGAGANHLLDLQVLAVVVVGGFYARAGDGLRVTLLAVVAAGLVLAFSENMRPALSSTAAGKSDGFAALRQAVPAQDRLLSEDASIPVRLGKVPVVTDAFMLARLLQRHPGWNRELTARIDARSFGRIVLMHMAGDAAAYTYSGHFGPSIAKAIERNYRLLRPRPLQLGGTTGLRYWVYEPDR